MELGLCYVDQLPETVPFRKLAAQAIVGMVLRTMPQSCRHRHGPNELVSLWWPVAWIMQIIVRFFPLAYSKIVT